MLNIPFDLGTVMVSEASFRGYSSGCPLPVLVCVSTAVALNFLCELPWTPQIPHDLVVVKPLMPIFSSKKIPGVGTLG